MKPLHEIKAALAERERSRTRITERPTRPRKPRKISQRTRESLSEKQRQRRRSEALASDDLHPLRAARIHFDGTGISQRALSERALVSVRVIQSIESGERETANELTARRLARALSTTQEKIGL